MQSQADIRKNITDKIVSALKSGSVPFWRRPWSSNEHAGHPTNAITGKPYRGTNWLLLTLAGHDSKWWATYNQWQSIGGQVRRGEHGTTAILYKPVTKTTINDDGEAEESSFALMRTFSLFHISQVDGDLDRFRESPKPDTEIKFVDYTLAEEVFAATGADVRFGGDRAFYLPSGDYIQLPPKESFATATDFYGVLAHETVHWSGHESRLNRLPKLIRFGSESYAVEELVAELGSAFLLNELGLPQSDDLSNVTAYLGHWLEVLQRDHTAIFTAAAAASAAVDHILEYSQPKEEAEVSPKPSPYSIFVPH